MDCEKTAEAIVSWLNRQIDSADQKGFIVGVSGGVDSALVSTLCAITGRYVACLVLPIHQNQTHTLRALEHIDQLKRRFENISSRMIDLTIQFDCLKDAIGCFVTGVVEANLRSRFRMGVLYSFSNCNNYMVAGTGNMVEDFGVGFFTKYGDGGVDISPIGRLTKTQVFELAAYLNVPESILKAKPTDGLWNDDEHSDEDQLGNTYPELEKAMNFCIDMEISTEREYNYLLDNNLAHVSDPKSDKTIRNYLKRHSANAHKMRMPPIGPEPV